MTDWNNTTVLITGATSGFGAAAARKYHALGAWVIATGRRADRLISTQDELGDRYSFLVFDVGIRSEVDEAMDTMRLFPGFNGIDILVNNAGLALGLGPAQEADLDDWETMVRTNINGVLYMTRAILPGMVKRKRGHIVNISSIAASWPYPGGNVYGATKAFLTQFSLNIRCDVNGTGVRVTSIEPGLCETEFSLVRHQGDAAKAGEAYANVEAMSANDIAEAIVWVTAQPPHVNVNRMELMATNQAWATFDIRRDNGS